MTLSAERELTCQELVELVTDYLEQRLSPEERARFERHIELCDGCAEYLDQIRRTIRALGRLPEESLSTETRERLVAAFRDWQTGV